MTNSNGLFLVLSNLAVLPAFIYAIFLGQIPEASILGIVGLVSFFYHLCQAGFYCIVTETCVTQDNFSILQFADEFFVFLALLWFIAYWFKFNTRTVLLEITIAFIFIAEAIVFIPLVADSGNFIFYEVSLIALSLVASFIWMLIWRQRKMGWKGLGLALGLIITGLILFYVAGDPGDTNYDIVHGVWHILLFIAAFFILDTRYGNLERVLLLGKSFKTRWTKHIQRWFYVVTIHDGRKEGHSEIRFAFKKFDDAEIYLDGLVKKEPFGKHSIRQGKTYLDSPIK